MKWSDGVSEIISDFLLFPFILCAFASLRKICQSEFRYNGTGYHLLHRNLEMVAFSLVASGNLEAILPY
jgi:hypothetical protein